jgi:hypothetical protein
MGPAAKASEPAKPIEARPAEKPAAPRVDPAALYPPSATPKKKEPKPTEAKTVPTPVSKSESLYPPGQAPAPPAPAKDRLDPMPVLPVRPGSPATTAAPSTKPQRSKIDDLLPPGADEIDALLPPGGDAPVLTPQIPLTPAPVSKPADDSLLPPGMGEELAAAAMQQVALPEEEMQRQMRELNRPIKPAVPKDAVVIETEEGDYVALREPVKTVGRGVEERELHVLPPEVKQKRRLVRNFIVYTIGLVVLIVTFALLLKM